MLLALTLVLLPRVFCSRRIDPSNWNSTSSLISTASAPVTRSSVNTPPYPIPSASGISPPRPTGTSPSLNDTSRECTINVPNARVDYWFPSTLEWVTTSLVDYTWIATNTTEFVLSASPVTEPFDVTQVLLDYGYTTSLAASTSAVTVTAIKPIPSPGIIARSDVEDYVLATPSLATTAVANFTVTSATPFVYFSAYEVVTQIPVTAKDGRIGYNTSTATFQLPSPYVYEYDGRDLQGKVAALGDVPKDFQLSIPQSSCFAGTWQAPVTVLIVVELVYSVEHVLRPLIVHIESSVSGLDFSPSTTVLASPQAHVESTVSDTDLGSTGAPEGTGNPNRVHVESSATTTPDASIAISTTPGTSQTPSSVAVGISVNLPGATNLPQLFSHLRSFITAFAHIEHSTQGLVEGGGGATTQDSTQGLAAGGAGATAQAQVTDGLSSYYVIGSETLRSGPSSVYVIGSNTLIPGAPPVTIGGTPVSLAPSATAIVVGGSTVVLPTPASSPAPTPAINLQVGSSVISAVFATAPGGGIILPDGGTLLPGHTTVLNGETISLSPSATAIVVGGSTIALPTPAPSPVVNIQVGSSVITAAFATATGGGIVLPDGGTLLPGRTTVLNGETISLAPSGTAIVVGGVTSALPQINNRPPPPVLSIGSLTITGNAASQYFIAPGETLTPGGTVTFSGTVISLGSSADYLVVGGSTQILPTQALAGPSAQITPPPLTIGNGVFAPIPGSGTSYLIGGSLLTPGGVITVANTRISLGPGASFLVVNGATTTLASGPITTNAPLLTIGTATITAQPGGSTYIVDGQTLTPGGIITVSGTVISLSPSATALIIINSGSSTQTETLFPATVVTASTAMQTGALSISGSAGATATRTASAHHGAAHSIHTSSGSLSLITLVLGYLLSWL